MKTLLAIDPGTTQSAWCLCDQNNGVPLKFAKATNREVVAILSAGTVDGLAWDHLAVEMVASYGMPVGREVFETVLWIGRFLQAGDGRQQWLVYRQQEKLHLCGSLKANDATLRQALINRFGKPGTKSQRGVLYGVHGDMWSAVAVGTVATDLLTGRPGAAACHALTPPPV